MLYRASWILRTGLLLYLIGAVAQAETINIKFTDLDRYARETAPRAKIIESEYARTLAERDKELAWSNPELAYDREEVGQATEYQVTVGKRFEAPWAAVKKRSGWNDRVRSAELSKETGLREHLAELKGEYVALQLLDEYLTRLRELKEILTDASHSASSRHTEGHLSGVEEHLIQMTVISLNANHQTTLQEKRELLAEWRASLGVEAATAINLVTTVGFAFVDLKSPDQYSALVGSQPGHQSMLLLAESFGKLASAERGKFIPDVNVYAGMKKVDPDLDGYVAGISLSLPLFNRNGAAARKYRLESEIARCEMQLRKLEVIGQVNALTESIVGSRGALAMAAPHFTKDSEEISNLLYSYEEGWLSLSELLNAVQIEVAGLSDYYRQLTRYYKNLFQLETITGEKLVSFEE